MDLAFLLLLPLLVFATLVIWIMPGIDGRRLRLIGLGVGLPLLVFLGDEGIGQLYLHARCSLEGGLNATSSVSTDGYFNESDHCLEALTRRGFKYYEAEVDAGYQHGKPKRDLRHYYLANKRSGECVIRFNRREVGLDARFLTPQMCVAFVVRTSPQSNYAVRVASKAPLWPYTRMYKERSSVTNARTGKLIASYTEFWWWGGWVRNNSFAENRATVCPSIGAPNSDVRDVILARGK